MLLVILLKEPILRTMGLISWYRRLFSNGPQPAPLADTQAAAERGDAGAQFALGLKYSAQEGVSRDFDQAARWYRKAADQNHAPAQFNLGIMLASGQGMPQDDAAALTWLRKSAQGGDAGAQFNLGSRCHRDSMDHHRPDRGDSRIEAYKWFHLAAAQGYKGSAAAAERVTLGMTREEVTAGNVRAATFEVRTPADPPLQSSTATTA